MLLILATTAVAAVAGVAVEARGPLPVGTVMRSAATWTSTGHRTIRAGALTLDEGPIDRLEHSVTDVEVLSTAGGKATSARLTVREEVGKDGGKAEELGLDGVVVDATWDDGRWHLKRPDGRRWAKGQKDWVMAHVDDLGRHPEDPLFLLLPKVPVDVGARWDIPLDEVLRVLARPGLEIDRAASYARVTCTGLGEIAGFPAVDLSFDVRLVPTAMKKATVRSGSFDIKGRATLPTAGAAPWLRLSATVDLMFDGTGRRGPLEADVNLEMHSTFDASRLPAS